MIRHELERVEAFNSSCGFRFIYGFGKEQKDSVALGPVRELRYVRETVHATVLSECAHMQSSAKHEFMYS